MNAGNGRDLPATEAPPWKRQLIKSVGDEIMPDIKAGPAAASLAIENVLRCERLIYGFYVEIGRGIIYGMGKRVERTPGKAILGELLGNRQLE